MSTTGSSNDGGSTHGSRAATPPTIGASVGGLGDDELSKLKRQVAALAANTAPSSKTEKPSPSSKSKKKNKNKALFGYWQATSTTEGHSAPPSIQVTPTTAHTNTNAEMAAATFAPPLGRPPPTSTMNANATSRSSATQQHFAPTFLKGGEFKPTAKQYDEDGTAASSSGAQGPQHRGEKWSPATDIRRGSVAKFTQLFGTTTTTQPDPNGDASVPNGSPTKGPYGKLWSPSIENENEIVPSPKKKGQHGEMWSPKDEIDTNQIDSIKAMWGAKAGGVISRGSASNSHLPMRPAPPVGRIASDAVAEKEEEESDGHDSSSSSHEAEKISEANIVDPEEPMVTDTTSLDDTGAYDDDDVPSSKEDGSVMANDSASVDGKDDDDDVNDGADNEDKFAIWEEIMELVTEVLPEEIDNVDDLLAQFQGRESKLRDALWGMQAKNAEDDQDEESDDQEDAEEEVVDQAEAQTDETSMGEEHDDDGAAAVVTPDKSPTSSPKEDNHLAVDDDDETLTSASSANPVGEGANMHFQYMNHADQAGMAKIASDVAQQQQIDGSTHSSSDMASPDDYVVDIAEEEEAAIDSEDDSSKATTPRKKNSAMMGLWAKKEKESQSSRSSLQQNSSAAVPETPTTSNITKEKESAKLIVPPPIMLPSNDNADDDEVDSYDVHASSLEDGTIESEESRHVSFMDATGLPLDHEMLKGIATLSPVADQQAQEDQRKATDDFTGRSYYCNNSPADSHLPNSNAQQQSPRPTTPPPEKQSSSSSEDTSKVHNQNLDGGDSNNMENEKATVRISSVEKGLPLVNARDTAITEREKAESEGNLSFVTFPMDGTPNTGVPSIDVPTSIGGLLKNGGTPTEVSEIPEPRATPPPTPWYKQRRTKGCCCVALCLLVACGVVLGLFFSGILLGDDDDDKEESDKNSVVLPTPPTLPPVASSSSTPSAAPSSQPISTCTESIRSQYNTLGLGNSRNEYAPNVAMDGNNAVVVTNSGGVRFYTLNGNDGGESEWTEVDYFPNLNRSSFTPAVALSGNVAVVGFLYQMMGFDQGTGGAYVYEQDETTGRWKRVDILIPDEAIDGSARFGWSVDVDAHQENPLIVVGAHGENEKAGSVYVYQYSRGWSQVGKVLPEFCPGGNFKYNFGYSVAVHSDVVAASTDCDFIVQLSLYNATTNSMESFQNIRYITFDLGAISSLVMDEQHLVYSTVYGGIAIYERQQSDFEFEFLETLDFSGNENLTHYPLAIDRDILAIGVGNEYWIFPKTNQLWNEGAFYIQNEEASTTSEEEGIVYVPSVAVSGRNVLAGSGDPHEVFHYDVTVCMQEMPTQSPTYTSAPIPMPTWRPSLRPSISGVPTREPTTKRPAQSPTYSNIPTTSPTWSSSLRPSISLAPTSLTTQKTTASPIASPVISSSSAPTPDPTGKKPTTSPTLRAIASPSASPVISTSSPSFSPTKKPALSPSASPTEQTVTLPAITPPPSASPTKQAVTPSPPTTSPTAPCYPVEISILYDSAPFGMGYVLTKVEDGSGLQSNIDTFFVPFDEGLANQRYTQSLCLDEGSYKFTMYDSYGDGLCCVNGNGEYVITSEGVILAQGGEFGYSEETLFDLPLFLF